MCPIIREHNNGVYRYIVFHDRDLAMSYIRSIDKSIDIHQMFGSWMVPTFDIDLNKENYWRVKNYDIDYVV